MRARCRGQGTGSTKNYIEKGITVAPEWEDFVTFADDIGPRPVGHTLDRIDNNKGYSKANCRWATRKEQQNNRSNNRWITYAGETLTQAQWADRLAVPPTIIANRIHKGWTEAAAVSTPVIPRRKRKALH